MARPRLLSLALAIPVLGLMFTLAAPALARPGGGEGGDGAALEEKARAVRAKAAELRAAGSTEDADHLERKAQELEAKAVEVRAHEEKRAEAKARMKELHERAAQAKADGRVDEARALLKEAEEIAASFAPKRRPPRSDEDFQRAVEELREQARALREKGSVEDAEHMEQKAARVEEALALRRESNELERRGKEAKEAGDEARARELMEASGRTWKRSEEVLGGPQRDKKPDGDAGGVLRGSPDEVRRRIVALRDAARLLREGGMPDRAEQLEKQAAVAERELEGRKESDASGGGDIDHLRAELEKLRRRAAEIEEEIRRRER